MLQRPADQHLARVLAARRGDRQHPLVPQQVQRELAGEDGGRVGGAQRGKRRDMDAPLPTPAQQGVVPPVGVRLDLCL